MLSVETKNLTKKFGKTIAVNSLNLSVAEGEIFGLVGPDGAGKTTTIRLLCALLDPDGGTVKVIGYDTKREGEKLKEYIGYMSQKFSLYGDLTVEENLNFFADIRMVGHDEREKRKKELYSFNRLEKYKDRLAANLSGGMKQKLALSCTLVHTPKILFLDEPTTGVDPVSRREFWDIIKSLVPMVTVFVSTPYMDEAEKCDHVGLIHEGSIMLYDTPAKIRAKMDKSIIELQCTDIKLAGRALKAAFEVEMFGDRLHIVSGSVSADMTKIKNILQEKNADIRSIKEIPPSLEDVFVWLLRK